ncbi:hypothetical protein HY967_02475 [Candidatus Jorgensenbacteria bacterium]|nr:hypothetical protein [Candidatus Jorgensenbacteria bacterium]
MKQVNFNEQLEHDLERLSVEIKDQRTDQNGEALAEREVLKRSIQSLSEKLPVNAPVVSVEPQKSDENGSLPSYLALDKNHPEVKREVEGLVGIVFQEGLDKAINTARTRSPFVEDAFHDALVDRLLPELKKRGII